MFVSSQNLIENLKLRYGSNISARLRLARNGFNGEKINSRTFHSESAKPVVCYFGTISTWFDFDVINKSLKDFPNLSYKIIGPIDGVNIPRNSRIEYLGTVEHDELFKKTQDAMAYIMPFKLNNIILSVDPVKLYEYINFNKDIISVNYPEVKRFQRDCKIVCVRMNDSLN